MSMKNIAFVVWMLGFPLLMIVEEYFDFLVQNSEILIDSEERKFDIEYPSLRYDLNNLTIYFIKPWSTLFLIKKIHQLIEKAPPIILEIQYKMERPFIIWSSLTTD